MPHILIGLSDGISDQSRALGQRFLSGLISLQGRGCPFTHAFMPDDRQSAALDPDHLEVFEAVGEGFRHGPWAGHHTPGTPYKIWPIEVSDSQRALWWQILEGWVGKEYDVAGLTGFVLRSEAESDEQAAEKLFCSESVALALKLIGVLAFNWLYIGPNQVSPWHLAASPLLAREPIYSYGGAQ